MSDEHLRANLAALGRVGARGHARAVADVEADGEAEWADGRWPAPAARGRPHLVHLVPQLRLGVGRYVVDLASAQQRAQGFASVSVVTSVDHDAPWKTDPLLVDELRGRGIHVWCAGDFFARVPSRLFEASARLRVGPATAGGRWIAHAHTAMAAAVAHWAGASAVVGTCHGVGPRPPDVDLQDALAWRLCGVVTSPSVAWATRLQEGYHVDRPVVIGVGLDRSRLPPGLPAEGEPRLVAIAELTYRKGLDVLLSALPLVRARHPLVTARIVGDGDARADLQSQTSRLGLEAVVTFAGQLARPFDGCCGADLFVLPSRSDNQPVAAIEAMLVGLPLVVSDVGGLGALARDAGCGLTVEPGNPVALANALVAALDLGHAARSALGARGRAHAERVYDVRATARAFDDVYRRALARADDRPGANVP